MCHVCMFNKGNSSWEKDLGEKEKWQKKLSCDAAHWVKSQKGRA